jgi:hypothetical protein
MNRLARLTRLHAGDMDDVDDPDDLDAYAPAAVQEARIQGLQQEIAEIAASSPRDLVKNMNHPANELAQEIYLLSQVGGVDFDSVIAAIKAQPKRLLTFVNHLRIPGRREERARWARALLTSYSENDALKAWFPRVPGITTLMQLDGRPREAALIRYALVDFPNWVQVAEKLAREDQTALNEERLRAIGPEFVPMPLSPVQQLREIGARMLLRYADSFKMAKIPAPVYRALVRKYNSTQLQMLTDTLLLMRDAGTNEVLAETVEGRRALQHLADADWREVLRDHDLVVQADTTARERRNAIYMAAGAYVAPDDAALERFHGRSKAFILPPGVRPLTTRAEFEQEGAQMGHCVAHYFNQRRSWCFAFEAPDGQRATLELTGTGDVAQFYGPKNASAGAGPRRLLSEFMQLNADNIKAMRKGAFPPKEFVQLELTNYPGEGVAQNPYRRSRR